MMGAGPNLAGGMLAEGIAGGGGLQWLDGQPDYAYPMGGDIRHREGGTCCVGSGCGGGSGPNPVQPSPSPMPSPGLPPGNGGGGGGGVCTLSTACSAPPGGPKPVPIPDVGSTYTTRVAVKGSVPGPCSFGAVGIRVTCVETGATEFTSGCPRPSGGTTNASFYNNNLITLNFTTPGGEGTACSPPTFPTKNYGSGSGSAMAGSNFNITESCS
jgi:hypothetical protein